VVAFALVAATVLKGIFDYAGTYLVNYAGFGMITDLRNNCITPSCGVLRRFIRKHTTGTLISTIVNDIERVQFAMSSVWRSSCSNCLPCSLPRLWSCC